MFLSPGSFPVLRELTEEERQQTLHSSDFQSFFDCSIRVMERALAEDGNIFFDYSGLDLEEKEGWAWKGGGRVCVWLWEHMCVCLLACLKLGNVQRLTHAHCDTLGSRELLCSSNCMFSCWCHPLRGKLTSILSSCNLNSCRFIKVSVEVRNAMMCLYTALLLYTNASNFDFDHCSHS